MATEVASLYTTLTQADEAFMAACKREASALEGVAAASEVTTATVAVGAAEQAAAVEAGATEQVVATEVARGKMATAWTGFTSRATTQWEAFTTKVQAGAAGIGRGLEKEALTAEQSWKKVSKVGEYSALALLAIGAESVKMASDFQAEMELVHTQAGAAQSEVDILAQKVLALAPTVGIGPEKLSEGLYHVESAGFRGAEAMSILAAAAKAAAIGQADLESTTQALIGVMASGIGGVRDAADAAAYLNTTVGIGDMRMEKLAAAIATGVLPSFVSAGLKMNDFSASIATLTDNVTPADEAASRLRMTVALLAAPSKEAMKALTAIGLGVDEAGRAVSTRDKQLKAYGITVAKLANDMQKPNGLLVAVMDLKKHLAGLSQPQQAAVLEKAFGGGRTSGAIMTLLNESDRLQTKYEEIGTASGRAAKMQDAWASTQRTFTQQLHSVGAQVQVMGIQVGTWLLPPLTKLVGFLASHEGVVKTFFVVLVAGMVAFTAAVVANTLAMLANPTTWIVLAIVAAVALLAFGIYELVKHWSAVWGFIKRIALDVWHWMVGAWNATIHALGVAAGWVKSHVIDPIVGFFVHVLMPPLKAQMAILVWAFKFAWGFVSVIFKDFVALWKRDWAVIAAVAKWAWDNVLHPVVNFIINYGLHPIEWAIGKLRQGWDIGWSAIHKAVSWAWDHVLKPTWQAIQKYGLQPVEDAIGRLGKVWGTIWDGIKAAVKGAWDFVKPIFDKIGKAADSVGGLLKDPGKAGSGLAHLLGFADGGWVPGPIGAPMLAVVHGGEFVVSRDMQMGRAPTPVRANIPQGGGAGGRPQIIENHTHVYIDGRELQGANMRQAGRQKLRNASTGLG